MNPTAIFNEKFALLNNQVQKLEREFANSNPTQIQRTYPNATQQEVNDKVYEARLNIINKLYQILPTLESDTKLTPVEMLNQIKNASTKVVTLSSNTVKNIALSESGIFNGLNQDNIDVNSFIQEIDVLVPTGRLKKEFIQIYDEDTKTMVQDTDYIEVPDYEVQKSLVIKDKSAFENTINTMLQKAVSQVTQQFEEQISSITQDANISADQIRFEAGKLFSELSTGRNVTVANGDDAIILNLADTNKQLHVRDHYIGLAEELYSLFLKTNGIDKVEEIRLVPKRIKNDDGTYSTANVEQKYTIEKFVPSLETTSSFGQMLFDENYKVQVQNENPDGTTTKTGEILLFKQWENQFNNELASKIKTFLTNRDNLSIKDENNSKFFDLFIDAVDNTTTNLSDKFGSSNPDDWSPNIPVNIFVKPEKQPSIFEEMNKQASTQIKPMPMMSNYNQQLPQQQVPAVPQVPQNQQALPDAALKALMNLADI